MKSNILSLILTILLLVLANIFMTTLFPAFGFSKFRLAFNVAIVMYFSLKANNKFLPLMIFTIQYFQSFFSIEGWELGTIAAIIISITITFLRDIIHLSNAIMIMIIAQVFQIIWFVIVSGILYLKLQSSELIVNKFYRFIPESIILSILTPFIFIILDKMWTKEGRGFLEDEA